MSEALNTLKPRELWEQFAAICAIPHPSKHEEKIRQYVISFAKSHNLEFQEDKTGNIVVRKSATPGYEQAGGVILQAHLDMVPQNNSDTPFNFETDPIQPYIDGEWVKARGTTLGADNGIGLAAMLAILAAGPQQVQHPALECLFTVDEETGLTGANGLSEGMLKGKTLINLDTEDQHELCMGCAGAVNVTAKFTYQDEPAPAQSLGYQVTVSGLKGGHSGSDIILQRANANRLLARFLWENSALVRLSAFDAGGLRNAIPREGGVTVAVAGADKAAFEQAVSAFEKKLQHEWQYVEPGVLFRAKALAAAPETVVPTGFQKQLVSAVLTVPNGVVRMSDTVPGLVETSTNLSRVEVGAGKAAMLFMVRCMVNYGKPQVVAQIQAVVELAGGTIDAVGDYDGWAPNPDSKILSQMKRTYRELYGRDPEVKAVHAGLECGIIGAKYPGLDMISIGPTICFPHSPDEKVEIQTVGQFYDFLLYNLKNLKG